MTTLPPSETMRRVVASPMPPAAPVMMTALFRIYSYNENLMVTFYPKQAGGGFVTYLKLSLIRFDNQFENFCISLSFSLLYI